LLGYLGTATSASSTDGICWTLESSPQQVITSVMTKLKKAGKGIVLMHTSTRQRWRCPSCSSNSG
jgi:hypothetical protein